MYQSSSEGSDGNPRKGPPAATLTDREVWWEVLAVLAVGVVPNLSGGLAGYIHPERPLPYWLGALVHSVSSCCVIYLTLYLIYRSGEGWAAFGLTAPRRIDLLLGPALMLLAEGIWIAQRDLAPELLGGPEGIFAYPKTRLDVGLMLLKEGANGFAEELVTRAYLITRFERLLGSWKALLLAAVLFGSYHIYQGAGAVVPVTLFGLAFGLIYLIVRRLWPLALGHMLFNIRLELDDAFGLFR